MSRSYIPKSAWHRIWLVFDLDNGDEKTGFYSWWFGTRTAARKHIKRVTKKHGEARLSKPMEYTRVVTQ